MLYCSNHNNASRYERASSSFKRTLCPKKLESIWCISGLANTISSSLSLLNLLFLDVMIAFSLTSDHTPLCFRMDLDPLPILPTQALSSFLIAGFIDPLL